MSLVAAVFGSVLVLAGPANALCVAPPADALSFEEMIDQEKTGIDAYPIMFLGIVASWHDLGGRPGGGKAIARLAVASHPVGQAPLVSDVRFVRQYPNVVMAESFEFKTDGRYVVLARRLDDGTFRFDGYCGRSKRLNHDRFRELLQYAKQH